MTPDEKAKIIWAVIAVLRTTAYEKKKPFDAGDIFFAMAFKSDKELLQIAKIAGVL